MIINYLKIAVRNLWKSKSSSFINIFGLTVGIAACLLIWQYISFEKSYDQFHENKDDIYRISMKRVEGNGTPQTFAFTYPAVAPQLVNDYPEVAKVTRVRRTGRVLRQGDKSFRERIYFVDSTFFDIFSFSMISGDSKRLALPNQLLLSRTAAEKYFGADDPVGKTMLDDFYSYEVAGVFEDIPENSHIDFDIVCSYVTYIQQAGTNAENSWTWSDFYTYAQLLPGTDIALFESKLIDFANTYKGEDMASDNYQLTFHPQALKDIYLKSDIGYELRVNGNIQYIKLLGIISLFILLICWFNYINLSTAKSTERAREVGVRKVVGAEKRHLVYQFLTESLLVNVIALALGMLAVDLILPSFSQILGKQVSFALVGISGFWFLIGIFLALGTLFAGLYPAFILSSFRPIQVLKSSGFTGSVGKSNGLKKILVVTQFMACVALIAATLTVYKQLNFMRSQDLGINIDETLVLQYRGPRDSVYVQQAASFKAELERNPNITSVALSGDIPGKELGNSWNLRRGDRTNSPTKRCRTLAIDENFLEQYGIQLVAGRKFSNQFGAEENKCLINETAMNVFGFASADEAIGKIITASAAELAVEIVGIVKDYHQESLKFDFKPTLFFYDPEGWSNYSVKLHSDPQGTVAFAQNQWDNWFPQAPLNYFFLDEFFDSQYQADTRFGSIFGLFSLLAIFIACLGLFGLSTFTISRRTKEIGIRKILGASVSQILVLMSKEYIVIVGFASLLALPVSYFYMSKWLTGYAYSIQLNLWFFLVPILMILAISMITIGYQSVRSAISNPVKSLRYE